MSEASRLKVLDFHTPRRPSVEAARSLSTWHRSICTVVGEMWAGLTAQQVILKPGDIDPMQYKPALAALPDDGLGIHLAIGDAYLPSLIVFSARQVHALLADLLDLPGDDWPEPKSLTSVEAAMLELLFQKLAEGIGEAWPGADRIRCEFLELVIKPARTRIFPPGTAFFVARIDLQSRFGTEPCHWLMPKVATEDLIISGLEDREPEVRGPNPNLVALTERVPIRIVVELGKVDLPMAQVATLAVGDVIMLEQSVSRPLTLFVEDQPKWSGVPLRIGNRQAFEITEPIEIGPAPSLYV